MEKSALILGKIIIVVIYVLNFLFKVQFLRVYRRKGWRLYPVGPFFFVLLMIVYWSSLIPRKLPCPKKFLVTHLFWILLLFWKLHDIELTAIVKRALQVGIWGLGSRVLQVGIWGVIIRFVVIHSYGRKLSILRFPKHVEMTLLDSYLKKMQVI